jgi:predicted O-methyltransferase YrrM
MLRFLDLDKSSTNEKQEDYLERYIQRLEKENEILRMENVELRKPATIKPHDESLRPIRNYVSWEKQKQMYEKADLELKRRNEKEKEA